MMLDACTCRLVLAVARLIDADGLSPVALDALSDGGVALEIDWHPVVLDSWRATVRVGDAAGPLLVDRDAAVAAVRALRAAVVHGVRADHPVRRAQASSASPSSRSRRR